MSFLFSFVKKLAAIATPRKKRGKQKSTPREEYKPSK
jgi:hypothetical protein